MDKLEAFLTEQPNHLPKALSRRELAYERIKAAIRHADLEPGVPLTETRLSKLLGISRTPVREALQQLVQEGLAESTPGHAVTVAGRSIQDVLDVVHIRSLLEPELIRLAAEAASNKQIEELEGSMKTMERAAEQHDLETWAKADVVFHRVIKEACPNGLLGETVVQLKTRVHHLANIDTHTDPSRLVRCTEEHREVVDAIKRRDSLAARTAMEKHISALTNSLLRRISYR
ncbi:MAG: GntR family transcriptional regulator [Trueperaceae bacterium]|nr:MAG: GntR family transcriptional regulator [Trueperaceae bacterium]